MHNNAKPVNSIMLQLNYSSSVLKSADDNVRLILENDDNEVILNSTHSCRSLMRHSAARTETISFRVRVRL